MGACGNGEGGRGLPLNPPFSSLFACPRVAHPPAHPPGPPGSGKPSGVVMGGGGGRHGSWRSLAAGGFWPRGHLGQGCGCLGAPRVGRVVPSWGPVCWSPGNRQRQFRCLLTPSPSSSSGGDAASGDHNAITGASDRQRIVCPRGKFGSLPHGLSCNVLTLGDNLLRAGAG